MSRDCNAELCPYWDGETCPCERFAIERPEPGDDLSTLPSATYVREENA